MSTVELGDDVIEAARREAARRGVEVTDVVAEAVQRFVFGSDLQKLLADFEGKARKALTRSPRKRRPG